MPTDVQYLKTSRVNSKFYSQMISCVPKRIFDADLKNIFSLFPAHQLLEVFLSIFKSLTSKNLLYTNFIMLYNTVVIFKTHSVCG